jgi:hypothetical protein
MALLAFPLVFCLARDGGLCRVSGMKKESTPFQLSQLLLAIRRLFLCGAVFHVPIGALRYW